MMVSRLNRCDALYPRVSWIPDRARGAAAPAPISAHAPSGPPFTVVLLGVHAVEEFEIVAVGVVDVDSCVSARFSVAAGLRIVRHRAVGDLHADGAQAFGHLERRVPRTH